MKPSTSTLALGFLLSVGASSGASLAADPGMQILLERADFWQSQQRFDLAAQMVGKVLALDPAQPDALYRAGLLARQRGDTAAAQGYLDRLRQVAPRDPRVSALTGLAVEGSSSAAPVAVVRAKPTSATIVEPARPAAVPDSSKASARVVPDLVPVSADSDDLTAASRAVAPRAAPSPRLAAQADDADVTPNRQLAALVVTTISDGDTGPVSAVPASGGNGAAARTVQLAQLELMPPLPVGGYQRPIGTPYSPDDTLEMDIDRSLVRIQAETNPTAIAGLGIRAHDGTSGLNQLTELGGTFEASFSPWLLGTARLTVLPVYLDAGTLGSGNLAQFGANPILAANGLPLVAAGGQHAGGVGILGGYSFGDLSAQLGTSPLGFPVTNLVGNVAYAPKFYDNTLTVRLEAIRQPVIDSVLSYAGTRASLGAANAATGGAFGTNPTWGGVVKTGGHFMVFYDNTVYGAYGGAGLATLTGENVPDNTQVDGLVGVYFRPYKTDDESLRVGIALYYTGYDKNLSGFTFGQGGYFSPSNYEALTFPVEYTGHYGNWSYLAAAAVGVQHFNQSSSPIFPNNPFAENALVATGANPNFSGVSSTGIAFNARGQIEYAIDNTLSIGASASVDNGRNYTEEIGKIYIRKTFDWLAPINTAGDPSVVSRDMPQSRL